jgi:hypothetical protein
VTEYQKGFLEGLQAICIIGEAKWEHHFKNSINDELKPADQEAALTSVMAIGNFVSDIKRLGSQVHRGLLDPEKISRNTEPYWWATGDGKGRN